MSLQTRVTPEKPRRIVPATERALVLEAVDERDVDLLLVEELIVSPHLQRIVFDAAGEDDGSWTWAEPMRASVQHSVPHAGGVSTHRVVPPSGETDIEVTFEVGGAVLTASDDARARFVLLIENKIGAPFMPRQPQRYLARASVRVESGECSQARALIVAPAEYLARVSGVAAFHGTLSYERIAAHFAERVVPWLRLQPQNPEHHWEGDVWMEYRRALAPRAGLRCDIVHKCPEGRVDLQLYGWAKEATLRPRLETLLEPGMYVPPVNPGTKSLMVTIPSPVVTPQKPFGKQIWAAEMGMRAAERLQSWYDRHADTLANLAATARTA